MYVACQQGDLTCSVGKIKKGMEGKGGFHHILEDHLPFLLALDSQFSCTDDEIH